MLGHQAPSRLKEGLRVGDVPARVPGYTGFPDLKTGNAGSRDQAPSGLTQGGTLRVGDHDSESTRAAAATVPPPRVSPGLHTGFPGLKTVCKPGMLAPRKNEDPERECCTVAVYTKKPVTQNQGNEPQPRQQQQQACHHRHWERPRPAAPTRTAVGPPPRRP